MKIYLYVLILIINFENVLGTDDNVFEKARDASRVVVAGGSITEIFYFLGEQDRIVALDVTSNFPPEAKSLPSIGYVRALSAEGLLSMNPSIILGEDDMGPPAVIKQLTETSYDLRIVPEIRTIDGIIEKIEGIASILDVTEKSDFIISKKLEPYIKKIVENRKKILKKGVKVMLVLNMQSSAIIVAGANTSGSGFIDLIGGENIFNTFEGWKPVSAEAILELNPDYIIVPQRNVHKGLDVTKIADSELFKNTNAGKNKNFIFDDAMAITGFGPRTINSALNATEFILK
tara:strand:- start:240 stop:1106 length:867 start_codon:yes stop_codon:yes gene_type:complete